MKLTMLGTGSAMASACYNTCFVLQEGEQAFLVDGGGGNQIFHQLQRADIDWRCIQDIFVTHKHMDHLLGALWMIRLVCQSMADGKYDRQVRVYGHEEVISLLQQLTQIMLVPEQIVYVGAGVQLITVRDGQRCRIMGREVTFFDICSEKALQFGFSVELDKGKKLVCCGDEPCGPGCEAYVRDSKWLMHEAFCLYEQREIFQPYHKHHSTVREACVFAQRMRAENLLLYHTEDRNLPGRKKLYCREGKAWFAGQIWVPEDLESLDLDA